MTETEVFLSDKIIKETEAIVNSEKIVCLRDQIRTKYGSHWLLNDIGHRETHFEDVFIAGIYINEQLKLNFDTRLILLAAYFHDLFSWERETHHILSSNFIKVTKCSLIQETLSDISFENKGTDISLQEMLSYAFLNHRSSVPLTAIEGSKRTKNFCQLLKAADIGIPCHSNENVRRKLLRSYNPETDLLDDGVIARCNKVDRKIGTKRDKPFYPFYLQAYGKDQIKKFQLAISEECANISNLREKNR